MTLRAYRVHLRGGGLSFVYEVNTSDHDPIAQARDDMNRRTDPGDLGETATMVACHEVGILDPDSPTGIRLLHIRRVP